MKPIKTLNKRRRRAESRERYDLFVVTTKTKHQGDDERILINGEWMQMQTGGMLVEVCNEAWKLRTKRSAHYRRRLALSNPA